MTPAGRPGWWMGAPLVLVRHRIFSPSNVELLIAVISWLTAFGLIAALIAEALR
jgi:hypothetical protein